MRALGSIAFGLMIIVAVSATAAPLDGSVPMLCAIETVMACNDPTICVRGTAATVNFPPTLKVDVGGRLVSGAATGRTAKITSVGHGGGRLLVSGEEMGIAGIAWNVVIVEASGAMSGAVLGHGGGFLMFGACTPGS
ncbi:MAG TPA: hypothetical protein VGL09_04355 [Methylomirabilota bacterium]|jgi:hypothetical protein